jgi:hypothetical protein
MKKIDLAHGISVLANLGVVAGIIFLAVEISQNNVLLASQARTNRLAVLKESTSVRLNNPDLRRAYRKAIEGEQLSPEEQELVRLYLFNVFNNWHYTYQEYRVGLLDARELRVAG